MDRQTAEQAPHGMSSALVTHLLATLQIPFDRDALAQAWEQATPATATLGPAQWLRQVLIQA